jgi:hypothetical protein
MRGIVGLVLGLGVTLLVLALGAGCKKENGAYCCTADSCSRIVDCPKDSERSYCDDLGQYEDKVPHACVADPERPDAAPMCVKSEDCPSGPTPVCVDLTCVECGASTDCQEDAPVCGAGHTCLGCAMPADCETRFPETPHCGSSGACVACRTGEPTDCDATSAAPVCDAASATCRGCQADGECTTGLCDEAAGKCVPENNIIHVNATALGGLGCGTSANPCRSIGEGVDATVPPNRTWVKVAAGTYTESLVLADKTVRVVADAGADVTPLLTATACAVVSGNSDVTLENLRLHDAGGGAGGNADGVRCLLGAGAAFPKLLLRNVVIESNQAQGLDLSACDVTLDRSIVRANTGGGIHASMGKLTVTRSQIIGNGEGGVLLTSCDFSMVNNFIVKNGNSSGTYGGVFVNMNPPSGTAGGRFEFNTVADNQSGDGYSRGLRCEVTATLNFRNNVVYHNQNDPHPENFGQVSGPNCRWTYSDIGPGPMMVSGAGNVNLDPTFVDPSTADYHLAPASLVRNAGTTSDVLVDFDGDPRPQGTGFDMGADEVTP